MTHMVEICIYNGIIPIIVSPPVYKTYFNSYLPTKYERKLEYITMLNEKYASLVFLEYQQDTSFSIKCFLNYDHLNPDGAKKISIKFNNTLKVILSAGDN